MSINCDKSKEIFKCCILDKVRINSDGELIGFGIVDIPKDKKLRNFLEEKKRLLKE